MVDELPTIWELEPHTQAKHAILERYLKAWFPILATHRSAEESRRILYIDGFAGPGEYSKREPGSPIIALRVASEHSRTFKQPVEMYFIEEREDRYSRLCQILERELLKGNPANIQVIEPRHGDCQTVLFDLLDDHKNRGLTFGPALVFLDQFGYGAVSMDLISQILERRQCEVFSYLNVRDMNRFITDPDKASAFSRAFGGNEWKNCIGLPGDKLRQELLGLYTHALKSRAGAQFVTSFLMYDRNNVPLYWLVFATRSLRGLEVMKKSMWAVDKSGSFRFSDRDVPGQLRLLDDAFSQEWLAEELSSKLAGQKLNVFQIRKYVLTETPCYLFKEALKRLERDRAMFVISSPTGRKPGSFPDEQWVNITCQFERRLL